jgi:hypothetical protein
MRLRTALCCCLLIASATMYAESKNPADYPLRLHIFGRQQTTFYHMRNVDESKGDGRANLFANGEARGVDFSYECSEKIRASFGYETYPAKWKKPNQELVVLMPVFGKAGQYFTCNFKTDLKEFTYFAHDGQMVSEPPAQYKAWMVQHDYDPEHGKNVPVKVAAEAAPSAPSAPSARSAPQAPAAPAARVAPSAPSAPSAPAAPTGLTVPQ